MLGAFVRVELRVPAPLIEVRIFADRGFAADNRVLFLLRVCFVPLFFFASVYAQAVLHDSAANAGLYLGIFFLGFATSSQVGGRILDARDARPAAIAGSAVAVAGFLLWADAEPDADLATQWYWVVLTGAGIGLVLSPASTDALNRAPRGSSGEVTGITQTVRYFASSVGLAILGTVFVDRYGGGRYVAAATQAVHRSMAGVMAACLLAAVLSMRPGRAAGV